MAQAFISPMHAASKHCPPKAFWEERDYRCVLENIPVISPTSLNESHSSPTITVIIVNTEKIIHNISWLQDCEKLSPRGQQCAAYIAAFMDVYFWVFPCVCVLELMHVRVCMCAQMAAPLMGACVLVSCNSRGWMEDRLSGSLGRVDRLLKTVERDTTASAHANSQNRHTVLVSVIAIDRQPSECPLLVVLTLTCSQRPLTFLQSLMPKETGWITVTEK